MYAERSAGVILFCPCMLLTVKGARRLFIFPKGVAPTDMASAVRNSQPGWLYGAKGGRAHQGDAG